MADSAAPVAPVAAPQAGTPPPAAAPVSATPESPPAAAVVSEPKPEDTLISGAKPQDTQSEKPLDQAATDKDAQPAPIFPDLKLPEGVKADDPLIATFTKDAKESGLSGEQVQKLVDKYAGKLIPADEVKKSLDASANLWKSTQQQWQEAVKSDPEVGGPKLATNLASIAKVIDSIGGDAAKDIREAFNFTGAGNNPAIIRFLHRVATSLNVEGRTITGGGPANVRFSTAADRLYGKPE